MGKVMKYVVLSGVALALLGMTLPMASFTGTRGGAGALGALAASDSSLLGTLTLAGVGTMGLVALVGVALGALCAVIALKRGLGRGLAIGVLISSLAVGFVGVGGLARFLSIGIAGPGVWMLGLAAVALFTGGLCAVISPERRDPTRPPGRTPAFAA